VAFHYFLWTCPWIGGDESEFDRIRGFVSNGDGDEHEILQRHECLVDRSGVKDGAHPDCHMFVAFANERELLAPLAASGGSRPDNRAPWPGEFSYLVF
jgi:hypothetical protein